MDGDILDSYNQTKLTGHAPTINARLNQNNNIFVARVMENESEEMENEGWEWDEERQAYTRTRFRKFTPRECFRLMDVADEDIDKIRAAGISECQQYKMAGNSIVVAVLYGIFERMFIDAEDTEPTLF